MLKDRPGGMGCADRSDCEPLGWHQGHDWHMKEQLDMLDSGLLSVAVVLLAFRASGGLPVIKTSPKLPPTAW